MPATNNRQGRNKIVTKAQKVHAFAERLADQGLDAMVMSMALFGRKGKAVELFPTKAEWAAFCQTEEFKRIQLLLDRSPRTAVNGSLEASTANGAISVRLPRSVHEALLQEAKAEGVSLNQLCVSKLVAQLRAIL